MIVRWIVALVLAFMLAASSAHAAPHVVVAVTRRGDPPADAPPPATLRPRIVSELRQAGYTVVASAQEPPEGGDPRAWIDGLAQAVGAGVGVLVVLEGSTARIFTCDRITGKTLFRAVPREVEGANTSLFALATAELVDASLIELEREHRTMQPEVAVPRDLPRPVLVPLPATKPRRSTVIELDVAVGMTWPVLASRPLPSAALAVGVRPRPRFVLALAGTVPLASLSDEAHASIVRSYLFQATLEAGASLLPTGLPWLLQLEGVVGGGFVRVEVDAAPGFVARPATRATPLVGGGLRVRRDFGPLHVGARIRAVTPVLPPVIEAADELVHDLRGTWIVLDLGVGAHW